MYRILRYVPKNHLSYLLGKLVHVRTPPPAARLLVTGFSRAFGIDHGSASLPLESYRSIGEFFVRDLKEGLRPVESELVSPVDGTLRSSGPIPDDGLEQIKGKRYSVASLLGSEEEAGPFRGGSYFNFYLSPRDYHHVHSPASGLVRSSVHVPGRLWPVNDWSLGSVDELFSVNERVVTYLETELGSLAVVMVGATNVGKMTVTYDSFVSNAPPFRSRERKKRLYDPPVPLAAGSRLGTFHMGSSVVLLLARDLRVADRLAFRERATVKFGESLLAKG